MPYITTSDGVKIYYEDHGQGETLLFSHGMNSSHLRIKNFIDDFKGDYRLVCYDHRGHGASERASINMNLQRLGRDLRELIEALELDDVTAIGHSMGGSTIFSYVNQFGCERLKRIVDVDMSPCGRNSDWSGGIAQGRWTDEDFMRDMDRIFESPGRADWYLDKTMINPKLANTPAEMENAMIALCGQGLDALTMASMWFSLYRIDLRPAMEKITVPLLYVMPETPLFTMECVDYIRDHVKGGFTLEKDFPGTTHSILVEAPRQVAERVKAFIRER